MSKVILFSLTLVWCLGVVVQGFTYDDKEVETEEGKKAMFERWRSHHNMEKISDLEKKKQYENFKNTLKNVHQTNKANKSYKLELNRYAGLSHEELRTKYTGLKKGAPDCPDPNKDCPDPKKDCPDPKKDCPDPKKDCPDPKKDCLDPKKDCPDPKKDCPDAGAANRDAQPFMYRNFTDIPPRIDWREKKAVGPVKNQQSCGCCYAFAAVETVEGLHAIKNNQLVELSPKEIVDCANVGGCNGGYFTACYEYIAKNGGLTTMKNYPYTPKVEPCNVKKEHDIAVEVRGYENMPSPGVETDIYKVVANQPLACSMAWNDDISAYKEGIYDGPCGDKIMHAISVVGYDQTPDGQKYWIIKNSWGEGWGEKGYMRLKRDKGGEAACRMAHWCAYPTLEDTGTKPTGDDVKVSGKEL